MLFMFAACCVSLDKHLLQRKEYSMSRSEVSFGDNHSQSQHRLSLPSIFRHRVGPDGNFMVTPIKLVDR